MEEDVIEILPGINITNNKSIKEKLLNKVIIQAIGFVETTHILESKNFLYYEYDLEDYQKANNEQFLFIILIWLDDLLKNSWLIKDNCMDCDYAFLGKNIHLLSGEFSSNLIASRSTLASGHIDVITLNKTEIREWVKIHDKVEMYLHNQNSSSTEFMLEKHFSRIGRCLAFVKAARKSINLAYKILNYCSAFETLLTTDITELSHKLSERAAFYLQYKFENKLDTYLTLKYAYNIRSKLTHGGTLKPSEIERLSEISMKCDQYLRELLVGILKDEKKVSLFDGQSDGIETYFNQLIFK